MPNNYILLETIALTQSAASVTFDNLPTSGYTDLKIVYSARSSSTSGYAETVNMKFNNSSTSDYSWRGLYSVTATPGSNNSSSVAQIRVGNIPSANLTANTFSNTEIYIPNYTSSNFKSVSVDAVSEVNGSTDFTYGLQFVAALRSNTAAITSINLSLDTGSTSFLANSTFSLYGIAALGTTPVLAPKATGGNIVANDGTYWYHAFLSSGNFVPQTNLTADIVVVAGGAGGAHNFGGGGGAGGLLAFTSQALTANTGLPCTVGAGGTGGIMSGSIQPTNGGDSQFGALTLVKGGGRGGSGGGAGQTGGSGGGGSYASAGGSPTSGQGNAGGTNGTAYFAAGGGGGKGAAGTGATASAGGNGGNGVNTYSSWATVTNTGANSGYYAGGGGGGYADNGKTPGAGGLGGGGIGAVNFAPSQTTPGTGVANTGGGGGGGADSSNGAAGGSGIILIRYPIA
jgi:hypothetical protein